MKVLMTVLISVAALGVGAAPGDQYPLVNTRGYIQEVRFESHSVLVSGTRYDVALDAEIEINGTYGALTLLVPGMAAEFTYEELSPTSRRIVAMKAWHSSVDVGT